MKFKNILFLLCCCSQMIWAQKDTPFKSKKLKLDWDEPAFVEPTSTAKGIEYKSILEKNDSNLKRYSVLNKNTPKSSVLEIKNDFKNPGDEYKKKLNKEMNEGSKVDVFFGKFVVNTPIIIAKTRDHMEPDGDKIRIIVNDIVVVLVTELEGSYKTHTIDLREGENLLNFLALNQGLSGPNTATFALYDGNGNLITTNDWNLNTGLSAKFLIDYKKPLEKK
jgi:hypothetical protein